MEWLSWLGDAYHTLPAHSPCQPPSQDLLDEAREGLRIGMHGIERRGGSKESWSGASCLYV